MRLIAAKALNWLNGWRRDHDNWLVRACRTGDPRELDPAIGFVEDACIAVRTPQHARMIDAGRAALQEGGRDE